MCYKDSQRLQVSSGGDATTTVKVGPDRSLCYEYSRRQCHVFMCTEGLCGGPDAPMISPSAFVQANLYTSNFRSQARKCSHCCVICALHPVSKQFAVFCVFAVLEQTNAIFLASPFLKSVKALGGVSSARFLKCQMQTILKLCQYNGAQDAQIYFE